MTEPRSDDERVEIERLRAQLALRDQACELGGEEVRRQRARADKAEAVNRVLLGEIKRLSDEPFVTLDEALAAAAGVSTEGDSEA